MPQFSRRTVLEACNFFSAVHRTHALLELFLHRLALDPLANPQNRSRGMLTRCLDLYRYVMEHPDERIEGRELGDLVVEEAVSQVHPSDERAGTFVRTLARDGYTIDNRRLRRTLPETLDLPAADNEVHALLVHHNLRTPLGHLDQAIDAHTRGNWAGANGQIRPFYESLFDEIALLVDPQNGPQTQAGEPRRQLLANLDPPFLSRDLNEWSNDGKNFVNGVLKRLHPQGPHPGLSDEEDSTFRLHLVLLAARIFLRRLDAIVNARTS